MNNWWCSETLVRSVRKLTRESFLLLVLLLGTIGAVVHGFLITNINSLFLLRHDDPNTIDLFSKHLLLLTLVGEMLGAISSFLFSDSFGRKTTLFYATIGCILALLLEVFAGGHARLLTARFLVGWTIGTMLPVGLTYISEVQISVCLYIYNKFFTHHQTVIAIVVVLTYIDISNRASRSCRVLFISALCVGIDSKCCWLCAGRNYLVNTDLMPSVAQCAAHITAHSDDAASNRCTREPSLAFGC